MGVTAAQVHEHRDREQCGLLEARRAVMMQRALEIVEQERLRENLSPALTAVLQWLIEGR